MQVMLNIDQLRALRLAVHALEKKHAVDKLVTLDLRLKFEVCGDHTNSCLERGTNRSVVLCDPRSYAANTDTRLYCDSCFFREQAGTSQKAAPLPPRCNVCKEKIGAGEADLPGGIRVSAIAAIQPGSTPDAPLLDQPFIMSDGLYYHHKCCAFCNSCCRAIVDRSGEGQSPADYVSPIAGLDPLERICTDCRQCLDDEAFVSGVRRGDVDQQTKKFSRPASVGDRATSAIEQHRNEPHKCPLLKRRREKEAEARKRTAIAE